MTREKVAYPHRIRLRGPWQCEPLAKRGSPLAELPAPFWMTMPCHWREGGLGAFSGKVRFRRRFGYPGTIDSHERVWLTLAGFSDHAELWVNEVFLGRYAGPGGFEIDITRLLQPRNEVRIEIDGDARGGGLWGEAALEIRCSAYLAQVHTSACQQGEQVRVNILGKVIGHAADPLEVYAILDRHTIGYVQTTASPMGTCFEIVADSIDPNLWSQPQQEGQVGVPLKLDLVQGAVSWYTWLGELTLQDYNHGSAAASPEPDQES